MIKLTNKNLEQNICKLKTLDLRKYCKLRMGKLRALYEIVGDVVYPKKLIKRHRY